MREYVIGLSAIGKDDLDRVGGKNASLGEMIAHLDELGIRVPDGFATTSEAFSEFLYQDGLGEAIHGMLDGLEVDDVESLNRTGAHIRELVGKAPLPADLERSVRSAFGRLCDGAEIGVAVRSSATAEDLPEASFAGQQDTLLNVRGPDNVIEGIREIYASLFNDRAIAYRVHQGFDHRRVSLSVAVQRMVRSDLACSGVLFTLDTESGFRDLVLISSSYGLGETVVQGAVNPDEFLRLQARSRRRPEGGDPAQPGQQGAEDGLCRRRWRARGHRGSPRGTAGPVLAVRRGRRGTGQAGGGDRTALRPAHGHRVGQGRRGRAPLHPAGPSGDREEQGGPDPGAVRAERAFDSPEQRAGASVSAWARAWPESCPAWSG